MSKGHCNCSVENESEKVMDEGKKAFCPLDNFEEGLSPENFSAITFTVIGLYSIERQWQFLSQSVCLHLYKLTPYICKVTTERIGLFMR